MKAPSDEISNTHRVLLVKNYSLDKLSPYEFRKWLYEKQN